MSSCCHILQYSKKQPLLELLGCFSCLLAAACSLQWWCMVQIVLWCIVQIVVYTADSAVVYSADSVVVYSAVQCSAVQHCTICTETVKGLQQVWLCNTVRVAVYCTEGRFVLQQVRCVQATPDWQLHVVVSTSGTIPHSSRCQSNSRPVWQSWLALTPARTRLKAHNSTVAWGVT